MSYSEDEDAPPTIQGVGLEPDVRALMSSIVKVRESSPKDSAQYKCLTGMLGNLHLMRKNGVTDALISKFLNATDACGKVVPDVSAIVKEGQRIGDVLYAYDRLQSYVTNVFEYNPVILGLPKWEILKEPRVLYRGQDVPLQASEINAFFSTSTDWNEAIQYATGKNCCMSEITVQPGVRILPIIEAYPEIQTATPDEVLIEGGGTLTRTGNAKDEGGMMVYTYTYSPKAGGRRRFRTRRQSGLYRRSRSGANTRRPSSRKSSSFPRVR